MTIDTIYIIIGAFMMGVTLMGMLLGHIDWRSVIGFLWGLFLIIYFGFFR